MGNNIVDLRREYDAGKAYSFCFFYGHYSRRAGIGKECFSQWYKADFKDDTGITFVTCEQYMMYQKALMFEDAETAKAIMLHSDPKACKALGRTVRNFNSEAWNNVSYDIVKRGNYYKFRQNPNLFKVMQEETADIFVEASPYDNIWGIGMSEGSAGINDPRNWTGANKLGFALTEVRDRLIQGL
jgi:ribA/ribD-fused uncharacterized protein